ncbi:MAG: CAP domain-containing protein [Methylobacteriaceae bacterium]|jgi:uncharacterized protein YkwD|nr:CAP domain-containing protein [Methylobacteriaceae bacterium]
MSVKRFTLPIMVLTALMLAGCSGLPFFFRSYTVEVVTSADAARTAQLVSSYRAEKGLGAVREDAALNQVAAAWARRQAAAGDIFHGDFSARMAKTDVSGAVENLAAGVAGPEQALKVWRESAEHNRNMLRPDMTRVGVAYARSPQSRYKHYWVMVLGK